MEFKTRLPAGSEIPVEIQSFTEEENEMMIRVGYGAVLTMRTGIMGRCNGTQEQKKQYDKWIEEKKIENKAVVDTYERMLEKERAKTDERIEQELNKERVRSKQHSDETGMRNDFEMKKHIDRIEKQELELKRLEIEKVKMEEYINHCKKEEHDRIERELKERIEHELKKERDLAKQQLDEMKKCSDVDMNKYHDRIEKLVEELKRLEIEKVKTDEYIQYYKQEASNKIERELEVRMREREEKMRVELEKNRERVLEYEKRMIQIESNGNVEFNKARIVLVEKHNVETKRLIDENHRIKEETAKQLLEREHEINKKWMDMTETHNKETKKWMEENQDIKTQMSCFLLEKEKEMNEKQTVLTEQYNTEVDRLSEENQQLKLEKEQEEKRRLMVENENNSKIIEELVQKMDTKSRSNIKALGTEGEKVLFQLLGEAFENNGEFIEIYDKSKTAHSGDMMAKFSKFTILIDSKVYKNGVDKKERDKIKLDISKNQYIKVAWLVSLDNPIQKYSSYPVMYEIEDGVLYVYINSLLKKEDPLDILRTAYFTSEWIFENILNKEDDKILLNKYKKNEIRIRDIVDKMTKNTRERDATIKQLKENFIEGDRFLREILNNEIMDIRSTQIEMVENWWKENIKKVDGGVLRSNVIYGRFMDSHPIDAMGINITEELFKTIILSFLDKDDIILGKSKNTPPRIKDVGFIAV